MRPCCSGRHFCSHAAHVLQGSETAAAYLPDTETEEQNKNRHNGVTNLDPLPRGESSYAALIDWVLDITSKRVVEVSPLIIHLKFRALHVALGNQSTIRFARISFDLDPKEARQTRNRTAMGGSQPEFPL